MTDGKQRPEILIVDDSELNRMLLAEILQDEYALTEAADGVEAVSLLRENVDRFSLILLDLIMPVLNGFEVLEYMQSHGLIEKIPVILITALGTLQDKIAGLDLGADDYLVKPFDFEELLARIRCVTRRSPILNAQTDILSFHDITWSCREMCLTGPTAESTLSRREGDLIECFLHTPEQVLARETLLLKVWGPDSDVEGGNLDNYVHFLRRRLKAVGSSLQIKTIRGVGYRLTAISSR